MELFLKNKRVFVSGSTAGIGYAIAKGFAKEGATVYLNGRSAAKVEEAIANIISELPNAQINGIVADLATVEGFEKVSQELSEINILINNLGIYEPVPFFDSKDEDWLKLFDVNVMSGIRLTRFYMPKMLEKNWGRVVFISSESALQIPSEMIHYGMSKTAQLSISNGLAQLTKGTGVTVNSVLPGPTFSEGVEKFIGDLAAQQNATKKEIERQFFSETRPLSLLQRFITPEEVAATVLFVSSEWAAATNGAAIRVEGGILKGL
ncbi:SDR family NAD(P)-dependent oxidoreductase [Runella sp. MFBS21]|uniref:SDR family NAD(P)-dependent oxidoreductase n=1 Tax=Runella sp. MFBS21 TaxID=3034018 RepID=UPI0023F910CC|nr:SDR family oxidoreductase [Runella sp. MFBS21]MDF7822221.1 SDR family NAD(P)-dependent oxidoreductase [Runella sp. MFBS21]